MVVHSHGVGGMGGKAADRVDSRGVDSHVGGSRGVVDTHGAVVGSAAEGSHVADRLLEDAHKALGAAGADIRTYSRE